MIVRAVAGAAVAAVAAAAGDTSAALQQITTCSWGALGTSFDLSPTHHTTAQGVYQVPDIRAPATKYYFNPCDTVAVPDLQLCTNTLLNGSNTATGWQIERPAAGNPTCYRLGGALASGWNFSFFDLNYPDRGVVLTYTGGDPTWCPGYGAGQQQRSLSLELTCDPTVDPSSATYTAGLTVREENTCDYRVQVPSLAGCPLECQTGKNLCNGNGVCGFNVDAQRSQCYCFNNFAGSRCDVATATGALSTEGVLLIIVCLALAAVVGLVGFMFIRLRKLQVDPAAYENLQGRFNELGQLT